MFRLLALSLVSFATATLSLSTSSHADTFRRLPGDVVSVVDCVPSADVVVGDASFPGTVRAYRWSVDEGLAVVGTRGTSSHAAAVSKDGDTVVGWFLKGNQTSAFVWKKPTGCLDLGGLGGSYAVANDVSAAGTAVVGAATTADGHLHAFRATFSQVQKQNPTDLGTLGGDESEATLVSADGETVIGRSQVASGNWHLFVWTPTRGMVDLGSLEGKNLVVEDATDDASLIVGSAQNEEGVFVPFMATPRTRVTRIPNVGDYRGSAELVSDDGSFIFGQVSVMGLTPRQAFRSRLPSLSVLNFGGLTRTRSSFVSSASDDGKVIGGQAQNRNGSLDGFLRVQGMEKGRLTSVDRVLNKIFENGALPKLHFVDVPCVSANGRTLIAKANVKGTTKVAFVHARIDRYPSIIDQRYFYTRPWNEQIATYVELAFVYSNQIYQTYAPIGPVYYSYVYADYARQYQALCAALIADGVNDAATVGQYVEYRAAGAAASYYNFYYAYYDIFLATGGSAAYSDEAAATAYAAYYYQQADLDALTGDE
ncbi:MAG TPA: hypothetical protein VGN57_04340 [Pirellulaceae bacterium]|jgi:probable HAF family extracellular repeat protein|nr:hypothetical protein [Pirellulaceae bacterium]